MELFKVIKKQLCYIGRENGAISKERLPIIGVHLKDDKAFVGYHLPHKLLLPIYRAVWQFWLPKTKIDNQTLILDERSATPPDPYHMLTKEEREKYNDLSAAADVAFTNELLRVQKANYRDKLATALVLAVALTFILVAGAGMMVLKGKITIPGVTP